MECGIDVGIADFGCFRIFITMLGGAFDFSGATYVIFVSVFRNG